MDTAQMFLIKTGLSRGADEAAPDAAARQIAQISGQMWYSFTKKK